MNSVARALMSLSAASAAACSSPLGADSSDQSEICREAYESILPARVVNDKDVGRLVAATYRMTELPRPDGTIAVAVTDVSAEVDYREFTERFTQQLGYFESKTCWQEQRWSGMFECYEVNRGAEQPTNTIPDPHTRAFLSVATYLYTGGKSDALARQIAEGPDISVPLDGVYEQISAPNHIDRWYICQSCGRDASVINASVALDGLKFGRTRDAIFFITKSGVVAKLADGNGQATYAQCEQGE
jgi:hypothetical protein